MRLADAMQWTFVDPFRRNRALKWFYLVAGTALLVLGLVFLMAHGFHVYSALVAALGLFCLADAALGFLVGRTTEPGSQPANQTA